MWAGLGPCKGKDTATSLGPCLVTGEVTGNDLLSRTSWTFEELTAYASRGTRVVPGDVLGSGTCGGGCLAELWGRGSALPPLRSGDTVTLTVEGLGSLTNTVVPGTEPVPVPRARRRSRARGQVRLSPGRPSRTRSPAASAPRPATPLV